MRTKYCTLIGRAFCLSASPILMNLDVPCAVITEANGTSRIWPLGMDEFSRTDGFSCWDEMRQFWAKTHPNVVLFEGVLIRWTYFKPTQETVAPAALIGDPADD